MSYFKIYYYCCKNGPVVQLVRTLACHARGREFEPHPDRQGSAYAELFLSKELLV